MQQQERQALHPDPGPHHAEVGHLHGHAGGPTRNVLGTNTLAEMLSEREQIAQQLTADLELATDKWGIHVLRVEIKDVCLARLVQ